MRLIDADALNLGKFVEPRTEWHQGWNDALDAATTQAPTIDAVPVCRCKDCIHWNKDALACDTLPWVDSSEHANWYADDFCSYGERKDGEG